MDTASAPQPEALTRDLLKTLATEQGLCLSLYAPMHRAGRDTRENPIRFKNLLQDARRQLESAAFGPREIDALLGGLEAQLDEREFWQHQDAGLAAFVAPGVLRQVKLPLAPPELCTIGLHFYLGPLVPALENDATFHLLELNLGGSRLLAGDREGLRELDLGDVPTSLEAATRFDVHQTYQNRRDVSPGGASGGAGGAVAVHGHGDEDTKKEDIRYFFKQLENGVTRAVSDIQAPLLLAGVEYLVAIYREANHYPQLHDEAVTGSPEGWRDEELHARAWSLLEPTLERGRAAALERYGTAQAEGRGSSDLAEVLGAAHDGRVDTLLLRPGAHAWGSFDPEARTLTQDDADDVDNDDLLDLAASHTLLNGGAVVYLETLSEGQDLAAIYRY